MKRMRMAMISDNDLMISEKTGEINGVVTQTTRRFDTCATERIHRQDEIIFIS